MSYGIVRVVKFFPSPHLLAVKEVTFGEVFDFKVDYIVKKSIILAVN